MVAKQPKIWQPGDTPMIDELAEELRQETRMMVKKIAFEQGYPAEDYAVSVCNDGMVCVHRMTADEKEAMLAAEAEQRRVIKIKKDRGVFDAV